MANFFQMHMYNNMSWLLYMYVPKNNTERVRERARERERENLYLSIIINPGKDVHGLDDRSIVGYVQWTYIKHK